MKTLLTTLPLGREFKRIKFNMTFSWHFTRGGMMPASPIVITLQVDALTHKTHRRNHKNTFFIFLVHSEIAPHISLPYMIMGCINVS